MNETFEYRVTQVGEIYALRCVVLRPAAVPLSLHFAGDDEGPPETWHVGAFGAEPARNVGCLTLLASEWEGKKALQLRGMAVLAEYRGRGVGRRLLRTAQEAVAEDAVAREWIWWCNARVEAIGFYERNGWRVASAEFLIEGVGPHRRMVRGG